MEVNENEGYFEDKSDFSDSEFQELVCKYKFYSNIQYSFVRTKYTICNRHSFILR